MTDQSPEIRDNDRKVALAMHMDLRRVHGALDDLKRFSRDESFESRLIAIWNDAFWGDSHETMQKRLFLAGSVWVELFTSDDVSALTRKQLLRKAEQFIDLKGRDYPVPHDLKKMINRYRSGHGDRPLSERSIRLADRQPPPESRKDHPPSDVPPAA